MFEKKFNCRRIIELPLNQESNLVVEVAGARHRELVRHPMARPKVCLPDTRVMEASKNFHEGISVVLRLDLFPVHLSSCRVCPQICADRADLF
jgi:hypothetical protein